MEKPQMKIINLKWKFKIFCHFFSEKYFQGNIVNHRSVPKKNSPSQGTFLTIKQVNVNSEVKNIKIQRSIFRTDWRKMEHVPTQ